MSSRHRCAASGRDLPEHQAAGEGGGDKRAVRHAGRPRTGGSPVDSQLASVIASPAPHLSRTVERAGMHKAGGDRGEGMIPADQHRRAGGRRAAVAQDAIHARAPAPGRSATAICANVAATDGDGRERPGARLPAVGLFALCEGSVAELAGKILRPSSRRARPWLARRRTRRSGRAARIGRTSRPPRGRASRRTLRETTGCRAGRDRSRHAMERAGRGDGAAEESDGGVVAQRCGRLHAPAVRSDRTLHCSRSSRRPSARLSQGAPRTGGQPSTRRYPTHPVRTAVRPRPRCAVRRAAASRRAPGAAATQGQV